MRPIITDAAWSIGVSVCLLVTTVSCAKADKPIEMPLGTRTRVGTRNDVLGGGGVRIAPEGDVIWGGPSMKYTEYPA